MTSFTLTINSQLHLQNDHKECLGLSLPITTDQGSQKGKCVHSNLSLNSHVISIGDEEEGIHTSEEKSTPKIKFSRRSSTLQNMLSSGVFFFGSALEKSSMFSLKAKRRSSSLKSGVDGDISLIPMESPVCANADRFQPVDSPSNLGQTSTLLCERSSDQQFTWDSAALSVLSRPVRHKESFSLPNTLERKTEESSSKQNTPFKKTECQQPKAWFIYMGNRPVSEGGHLDKELNNVTSLDSGVDVIESAVRNGFGGLNVPQKPISPNNAEYYITNGESHENPEENDGDNDEKDECMELHISHQEAARMLNPKHYSRSVWEKREERPVIGVY